MASEKWLYNILEYIMKFEAKAFMMYLGFEDLSLTMEYCCYSTRLDWLSDI